MERAFLYGDLIFETMLATGGSIPLMSLHYSRLVHSAKILKIDLCGLNEEKFNTELLTALHNFNQNHSNNENYRVRFVLFRKSNGTYLPESNDSGFNIEVSRFEPKNNAEILQLGIYTEQQKAAGGLANIKSGNALIYVMASIWAKENNLDGALIRNTNGQIIESNHSNIFWRKNNTWFTPPLADGCVAGIGREIFMLNQKVQEQSCYGQDLLNADECIITNALNPKRGFNLKTL
jgi:branched-chain amino acid aminotransferase